jgi:hypothetical protein
MTTSIESKADKFYEAIVSMPMSEYLDMVEYFGFGYSTPDRTEIEECIPCWDMALELLDMGYQVSDLFGKGYKYTPDSCPL